MAGLGDAELDLIGVGFEAGVGEGGDEPLAGEGVVVAGEDFLEAGVVVGSGGEVGAEEESVVGAEKIGEEGEDLGGLEVGKHAEEGEEAAGRGGGERGVDAGGVIKVEDDGVAGDGGKRVGDSLMGGEGEGEADVAGDVVGGGGLVVGLELLEEGEVFLAAAAAEADELDGFVAEGFGDFSEGLTVGVEDGGIGAGGRMGFVKGEPAGGLLGGFVVEAMGHLALAERGEVVGAPMFGEGGGVDGGGDWLHLGMVGGAGGIANCKLQNANFGMGKSGRDALKSFTSLEGRGR